MKQTQMVVRKRVEGRIEYNDGEFAEVQTVGIEGIEENLLLEIIQIHREDTNDTPAEFQRRFPVGMWLDIVTTTDITAQPAESSLQNWKSSLTVGPNTFRNVISTLFGTLGCLPRARSGKPRQPSSPFCDRSEGHAPSLALGRSL